MMIRDLNHDQWSQLGCGPHGRRHAGHHGVFPYYGQRPNVANYVINYVINSTKMSAFGLNSSENDGASQESFLWTLLEGFSIMFDYGQWEHTRVQVSRRFFVYVDSIHLHQLAGFDFKEASFDGHHWLACVLDNLKKHITTKPGSVYRRNCNVWVTQNTER